MRGTLDAAGDTSVTFFSGGLITNSLITSVTNLSGVGGGNVPFKGLNLGDGNSSNDVLVTSEILPLGDTNSGTVNSNSSVLGVGTGNELSQGEVIRYDLVKGLNVYASGPATGHNYSFSSYQQTAYFKQKIHVEGSSKDADMRLQIFSATGSASSANTSLVGTTAAALMLTVGEIVIRNASGAIQSNSAHVAQDGNAVVLYNLGDGWTFEIKSVDALGNREFFNALEIQAVESTNGTLNTDSTVTSFKLGQFSFGENTAIGPVNFKLPVEGFDSDGDSVTSAINVTAYPSANSRIGTAADETLTGDAEDNYLFGLAGNDTLLGNDGNDVLIGGLGNDRLVGGAGNDLYLWQAGDVGSDVVIGFAPGNDRLDFSDLLKGEHGTATDIGNLLSYMDVSMQTPGIEGAATDTVIKLDVQGAGDFAAPEQTVVLADVNLFAHYGVSSEEALVKAMLADATLRIDTV